ncbi:tyrosine-type recombinase/integrase [Microvirga brassicacearum]|uniref:Integrase n=1 Tax=Microvirga brassicacearum TaxID=2580413 RepID=A0A5N3P3R0_9HYPH|nr:tyrosine-type recombinase/integrase [Microvirga brassicacearum]KAB0264357.1 hypothetical protein FEZ63_23975 [Microvirga brassicacearum]
MALSMARPSRDKKTGVWYLRQRPPADIKAKVLGGSVTIPIGDGFRVIKVGETVEASLGTKDANVAKERHAQADATLRKLWEAHRHGPQRLTQKQVQALAGKLYFLLAETMGDDPGRPETWLNVIITNAKAKAGRFGRAQLRFGTESEIKAAAIEERFGGWVDILLSKENLVVDSETRTRLLNAVAFSFDAAALRLAKNADGDYSPDAAASRFPAWEAPLAVPDKTPSLPKDKITAWDLFERWEKANQEMKSEGTIKRYRASWRSLSAFTKDKDVRALTGDDIHEWAVDRRDRESVSPKSINQNDLVAASSVFKWAMGRERRLVTDNPAAGLSLDEPRVTSKREKTFREKEWKAILTAASNVVIRDDNSGLDHACRWTPWLAAYSGARIRELCFLDAEDIRMEEGTWVMDLRQTKTGKARTVPLHEHLVEQGFIEFAQSKRKGPLFYNPKRHKKGASTPPDEIRAQEVADWVRGLGVLPTTVAPTHGWRGTFKTRAIGADMDVRIRDAIAGHSARSVARDYEQPPVGMLAEALKRFPRYET